MKILGIEFAPLDIPLHRRLETLSAFAVTFLTTYLAFCGLGASIYFIVCPLLWPLTILYVVWMMVDWKTPLIGGRYSETIRSWSIFQYAQNYYPIDVIMPDFNLNPKKNYLFCYFPHGTITTGPVIAFLPKTFKGRVFFPHHQSYGVTLNGSFNIPIYREVLLSLGFCSANPQSFNSILGHPNGGRVLGLMVGGASEAYETDDDASYRIVLKNRKGFVKLALRNGSPLVPCFSYGENKLFRQLSFAEGTTVRRIQEWVQRNLGMAPIFFYGRGFFQYTFGWVPLRNPINIVVGDPIDLPQIENPTIQEIDTYHNKFIEALCDLFEKHKYRYEKDPENCKLIIS